MYSVTIQKLMKIFNERIIGQEEVKRKLATAVYMHYKTLEFNELMKYSDGYVKKHSGAILLYGPSGSGKTEFFRCLRDALDIPCKIIDTSTISGAGYKGRTLEEEMIDYFIYAESFGESKQDKGIIVFDEFDKLCDKARYGRDSDQAYNRSIMDEFLKLIEGKECIDGKDTGDILFILTGSFGRYVNELNTPVEKTVGFGCTDNAAMDKAKEILSNRDFIEFGFTRELLGRISLICKVDMLSTEIYKRLLKDASTSPLKDYELLFSQNNSSLHFTPSAVSYIAEEAAKLNLGVRGIHRILDSYMFDLIYHTDGQEQINVSITGKDMQENRLPRIQKFCYM